MHVITSIRHVAFSLLVLVVCCGVVCAAASAERMPVPKLRPMVVHKLPALGLEVWTEAEPRWLTATVQYKSRAVFTAQTPVQTYPPAVLTVTHFSQMRLNNTSLRDAALMALRQGAANFNADASTISALRIEPAVYGALSGYTSRFQGRADGQEVDVQVFLGHSEDEAPVLLQAYTLKGHFPSIRENIRRMWENIAYLDAGK